MSKPTAVTRQYASEEDLRQADLSRLKFNEMTPREQAEMKRRLNEFMAAVRPKPKAEAEAGKKKAVTKWAPKALRPGGASR